jgi:excinuclease ABC subunit A
VVVDSIGPNVAVAASPETLRIHGARVHNLQNIDLEIPRGRMVVITGPSGSGKSSLAFDTIFAEGQRQYIESLSVYARQFLRQLERPDVDLIEGLQPTVAIDQRAGSHNPRSTVATVTEVYDHLRLLMARVGLAFCYQCGAPIRQQSQEQILDDLLSLPPGTKVMLLAPLVRGRKGEHKEVFDEIRKAGFVRARVDGEIYDLDAVPELARQKMHQIEAVVDRLIIREGIRARLAESIQLALTHGQGLVIAAYLEQHAGATPGGAWRDRLFSTDYACPNCQISYEELEPRTFSFNSPYGACPECDGLGSLVQFDPELVLPDPSLSLEQGAVAPWRGVITKSQAVHREQSVEFLQNLGATPATPLAELRPTALERLLRGDGKQYLGLLTMLEQEYVTATKPNVRERLETFRGNVTCAECGGARLRREARSVRVGGKAIHEITALTVDGAREFFHELRFDVRETPVGTPIVREITARLDFLLKVGLSYLTLDRPADTLSGGELQRIRLATGLGSGLVGACYVLDEPSIGLHPRDNGRLIDALRDLQRQGNSVLVVEHDEAMMRAADELIDLGPGAGRHGGRVTAQGTCDEVSRRPESLTGRYLSGELSIPTPASRRAVQPKRAITIEGVTTNNLKNVTVQFPLSTLACVTGVSGSGKSSLVNATLARAIARKLAQSGPKPGPHASLRGVSQIDKLVTVDQSPIGRTPRSNPATYTGLFDEIRKVFAQTRDARLRGFKANRFSFNVAGGRCEECQGQGQRKLEMSFLPDLYVTCPACQGARFNRQTLEVKYRGLSIADVLNLRVDEAVEFFTNFAAIERLLASLCEVGLEYLTLGQSSTTLSGGEAQRIKLATELGRTDTGNTLYLLDEPTTGLHFDDIRKLLHVLNRLVNLGNTVIVIEHNLDVMKSADWIIDLGPEGGAAGGYVLAEGPPEAIGALAENETGRFLRIALNVDQPQ